MWYNNTLLELAQSWITYLQSQVVSCNHQAVWLGGEHGEGERRTDVLY